MARAEKKRSVILIDPHGELAEQCAKQKVWYREHQDSIKKKRSSHLVYLSAQPATKHFPNLNPFDLGKRTFRDDQLQILASSLARVFTAMLSKGDVQLSLSMRTLLTPMLLVLLTISHRRDVPTTFLDLARFLDERCNGDLVRFGMTQLPHGSARLFFVTMFSHPQFSHTRFSLRVKLASLLNSSIFTSLMCQPRSTFDLRTLMNSGKATVINASKSVLGEDITEVYGRTIMALIRAFAFLRPQHHFRRPVYVIVDEAPTFLSEDWKSLLAEVRKFGVHAIFAQQMTDQSNLGAGFEKHLLANTALKIVGDAGHATRMQMAKECETPESTLRHLSTGTFLFRHLGGAHYRVQLPKYWLDQKGTMNDQQWQTFLNYQRQMYTSQVLAS